MIYLYVILLLITFVQFFRLFTRDMRQAVLVGLTFIVFVPVAIPIQLLPISGVVVALQIGFVILAFLVYQLQYQPDNQAVIGRQTVASWTAFALLLAFWLLLFIFCYISPDSEYGFSKTLLYALRVLLPLIGFSLLLPITQQELRLMMLSLLWGAVLVAFSLFVFGDTTQERDVGASDSSPITVARAIGLGSVFCLTMFLTSFRKFNWAIWGYLIVGLLLVVSILFTGSRGPLTSVGVAALSVFFLTQGNVQSKIFSLLRVGILVGVIFAVQIFTPVETLQVRSVNRALNYLGSIGNNSSDLGRLQRIDVAWQSIEEGNLIGVGTGGFTSLVGAMDHDYPHNVFLEVMVEQGVIGLVVLLLIFIPTLAQVISLGLSARGDPYFASVIALFFYSLMNALISGDVSTNQLLWITIALVWIVQAGITYSRPKLKMEPA